MAGELILPASSVVVSNHHLYLNVSVFGKFLLHQFNYFQLCADKTALNKGYLLFNSHQQYEKELTVNGNIIYVQVTKAWGEVDIIIIIMFINCNWVVTRWQWLFYMYTKYEIGY